MRHRVAWSLMLLGAHIALLVSVLDYEGGASWLRGESMGFGWLLCYIWHAYPAPEEEG